MVELSGMVCVTVRVQALPEVGICVSVLVTTLLPLSCTVCHVCRPLMETSEVVRSAGVRLLLAHMPVG